jgi:sugar-specific transcriptional regulator TrmB
MADDDRQLLEQLGLTEYEATALDGLLAHGRTTAPNLTEATGIPNARIYGVLEELANDGYIEVIPGRPKEYQPKAPEKILDRAIENRRQAFESYRATIEDLESEFIDRFDPQYRRASEEVSPTEELFYVVDVGEPSESETTRIYHEAKREVNVLTKSFEYLPAVEPAIEDALDRGVAVDVLCLHPRHLSAENKAVQAEILDAFESKFPDASLRFSEKPLPWRGTLADPSMEYDSGTAIVLVEEKGVPLHMRQAAVTENGSFVAGMKRYFDLIWEYESTPTDDPS